METIKSEPSQYTLMVNYWALTTITHLICTVTNGEEAASQTGREGPGCLVYAVLAGRLCERTQIAMARRIR